MALRSSEPTDSERLAARDSFNAAAKKFGIDVNATEKKLALWSKEKHLEITQRVGHGLTLGYNSNGKELWLGPRVEKHYRTTYSNTNDEITVDEKYPGITISPGTEEGTIVTEIAPDHPVAKFVALVKSYGWAGDLALVGGGGKDGDFDPNYQANVEVVDRGGLKVVSKPGQQKLRFTNVDADFQDGGWKQDMQDQAKQRLKIRPRGPQ